MELKEETVRALSAAAQIALTDAEIIKYGRELAELESMCAPLLLVVGQAESRDTAEPTPLSSLRDDTPAVCEGAETLLGNIPERYEAYIRVPRVIGEGGAV